MLTVKNRGFSLWKKAENPFFVCPPSFLEILLFFMRRWASCKAAGPLGRGRSALLPLGERPKRPENRTLGRFSAEAGPEAPAQKPRPETPEPKPASKPAPAEKPADAPQRPTRAYGGRPATRTAQGEYRPQRYAPNPAGERQRPGNPRFGGYPAAQPRAAVPRPEAAAQPAQANEAAPAPKPEAAPRPEAASPGNPPPTRKCAPIPPWPSTTLSPRPGWPNT